MTRFNKIFIGFHILLTIMFISLAIIEITNVHADFSVANLVILILGLTDVMFDNYRREF